MDRVPAQVDVAVIGGGIAGLTAASFAARAGATVQVFDARSALGGRARTKVDQGFAFNEGPHALYRATAGMAALRELGLRPKGGQPSVIRTRFSFEGRLIRAPRGRTLSQFVGFVRRIGRDRRDPGLVHVSAQEWIDGRISDPVGRLFAASAVRLSSYTADLSTFSADAAATQLHAALRGVIYLHGGWAQLTKALDIVANSAGAAVEVGARVSSVDLDGDRYLIGLGDDRHVAARTVIIAAGGPTFAARLVGGRSDQLNEVATSAIPVHAACLDLGLRRLPRPSTRLVLGVDKASYANVHTPSANLAEDGHVMHVSYYEPDKDIGLSDLESLADEVQPGWRATEVTRQIGHRRVVAFDRPRPGIGLPGRQSSTVDDLPRLFVAGDWVGPTDLLGAASVTSGKAAGLAAAAFASTNRPALTPSVAQ